MWHIWYDHVLRFCLFWAHLCKLHGGLICIAFRLSVHLSVTKIRLDNNSSKKMLTIAPLSFCLYACHMCKSEDGLYVNIKLHLCFLAEAFLIFFSPQEDLFLEDGLWDFFPWRMAFKFFFSIFSVPRSLMVVPLGLSKNIVHVLFLVMRLTQAKYFFC